MRTGRRTTISVIVGTAIILAGERIYRRALMQTGSELSIRQALKLAE